MSDSCDVGSPLPTPMSLPEPVTVKVTSWSVIGSTRPCASCTSTAQKARSSPFASNRWTVDLDGQLRSLANRLAPSNHYLLTMP